VPGIGPPGVWKGKGNRKEENKQKYPKCWSWDWAKARKQRINFVRCGPSYDGAQAIQTLDEILADKDGKHQ